MIDVAKSAPRFWDWFINLTWIRLIAGRQHKESHLTRQSYIRTEAASTDNFRAGHDTREVTVINDSVDEEIIWLNRPERSDHSNTCLTVPVRTLAGKIIGHSM